MTPFQRAILAIAVAALLLFAWMFRYQLGERLLVLDRWTGVVHVAPMSEK